jgi:Asp/Glu/hydantoin racemase
VTETADSTESVAAAAAAKPFTADSDPATVDPIRALCRCALAHDKSRSTVSGCAAMTRFAEPLSVELGVPVIDGVAAATVLAEAAPRHGVMNSAAL